MIRRAHQACRASSEHSSQSVVAWKRELALTTGRWQRCFPFFFLARNFSLFNQRNSVVVTVTKKAIPPLLPQPRFCHQILFFLFFSVPLSPLPPPQERKKTIWARKIKVLRDNNPTKNPVTLHKIKSIQKKTRKSTSFQNKT